MKRKLAMAAILGLVLVTAGCSTTSTSETTETEVATEAADSEAESSTDDAEETEAAERPDYTALDYVTLGEYKGLEVTLASTAVTDEEIDEEIESALSSNDLLDTLEEGTVQEGDIANIDYEGKKDGEAFDGGTDKGYDLTIGSGTFIDGFEDGLVGVAIGDTVDLELTFPESYSNEDLAGQDVVFTVTVNSVQRQPEFTDELAAQLSDSEYNTVDEYRAYVEENLKESKESSRDSQMSSDLLTLAYENSTINGYPQELVDYIVDQYVDYYTQYAEASDLSLSDFIEQSLGTTEDDFYEQIEEMAKQSIEQEMILKAIAETEELTLTDEEYQERALAYADQMGLDGVSGLEEQYGQKLIETNLLLDKALELIEDNAVKIDPDETDAEDESESASEAESETETETETAAE
jgi:trigger factor